MTPEQRGDLAERMLPIAAQVAAIVHGDGGPGDVAHALAGLTPQETTALIVVLAALTDPDQALTDALGWITWDETGLPLQPDGAELDARTVRQAARQQWIPVGYRCPARDMALRDTAPPRLSAHRYGITERTLIRWKAKAGPP